MMRSIALFAACAMGLSAAAQTGAAPAASPKIAIIAFQAVVGQTNEFQRDFADLQKKFEPKRTQLKSLSDEIEGLDKQLQAQGDKLSDSERATRTKTVADKKKQAQRLAEDAQNDFQQAMQQLYGSVATKVDEMLNSYAQQQGYTLVVDVTQQQDQQPVVLWASPSTDISKAVVEAYNQKSGVAAPAQPVAVPKPAAKAPAGR